MVQPHSSCKKNGSILFCVDYRKVNEVSQYDAYQLNGSWPHLCGGGMWQGVVCGSSASDWSCRGLSGKVLAG